MEAHRPFLNDRSPARPAGGSHRRHGPVGRVLVGPAITHVEERRHGQDQDRPDVDSVVVADLVDRTAKAAADAKVRSSRAVLVEPAARDELARLTA